MNVKAEVKINKKFRETVLEMNTIDLIKMGNTYVEAKQLYFLAIIWNIKRKYF